MVCEGISENITTSKYLSFPRIGVLYIYDGCVDVEQTRSDEVMERREERKGGDLWRKESKG